MRFLFSILLPMIWLFGSDDVAVAGNDINSNVDLMEVNAHQLVVSGIQLQKVSENEGQVVAKLHTRVGLNQCYAIGIGGRVEVVEDFHSKTQTLKVNKHYVGDTAEKCTEEYFPAFEDMTVVFTPLENYTLVLDTNTEELGKVPLTPSPNETVIASFDAKTRDDLYGATDWQATTLSVSALAGKNECEAENSKLRGVAFSTDDALRIAVINAKSQTDACREPVQPVFRELTILGTFKPGDVSKVEVENWQTQGNSESFALPELLQ